MEEKKSFDSYLTDDNLIFIENEFLRLGANISLGGALTHLSEKGKKNLLNSHDWGRQVQMSFYAPPVPYNPEGTEMAQCWRFIGWNPIQSGDYYRNRSRVLEYRADENEIYVKCIPMHWPLNNVPGECSFEVWYRLDGYCVNVTSRINMDRPDKTQYDARWQELPAVYTNGEWYKGVSYIGKKPFTGDSVTELVTKENGLGWPWLNFCPTEHWSALLDDDNYGLGVFNGTSNMSKIGFFGEKGWGGPRDDQTGYIAPLGLEILDHNAVYTYDYSLIVGNLDFIRKTACEKSQTLEHRNFSFEKDRSSFTYKDIQDRGYPTGGCLDFDFSAGSELRSPVILFKREDCQNLAIDADFAGDISGEVVFYTYETDKNNCVVRGERTAPFAISGEGRRETATIDLSAAPDCYLGFALRFSTEGHLRVYSVEIK